MTPSPRTAADGWAWLSGYCDGDAKALEHLDHLAHIAIEAEAATGSHPRTYSLTASGPNGELFLVTDDESGINIGHAKLIGGPLTAPGLRVGMCANCWHPQVNHDKSRCWVYLRRKRPPHECPCLRWAEWKGGPVER